MCIVIDMNTLSNVFQKKSDFVPVFEWIYYGNGFIVYGGAKYKEELKRTGYVKLFKLLKDARKAYEVDQAKVDRKEEEIIAMTTGTDCNDQHIIAIFSVSKCRLFCSLDRRSYKYVQDKRLYPKGQRRPSIYRSIRNRSLLKDTNIIKMQNSR